MKKIFLLSDYKNRFELKFTAKPYRSGMNINLLKRYFSKDGYELICKQFSDINFDQTIYKNQIVLYTSQEDSNHLYKGYIDDWIYSLHLQGAYLIPQYKFLKAHENKVFMEMLRNISIPEASLLNL